MTSLTTGAARRWDMPTRRAGMPCSAGHVACRHRAGRSYRRGAFGLHLVLNDSQSAVHLLLLLSQRGSRSCYCCTEQERSSAAVNAAAFVSSFMLGFGFACLCFSRVNISYGILITFAYAVAAHHAAAIVNASCLYVDGRSLQFFSQRRQLMHLSPSMLILNHEKRAKKLRIVPTGHIVLQ